MQQLQIPVAATEGTPPQSVLRVGEYIEGKLRDGSEIAMHVTKIDGNIIEGEDLKNGQTTRVTQSDLTELNVNRRDGGKLARLIAVVTVGIAAAFALFVYGLSKSTRTGT
jgi:hypothetical protein